jgi:serine/threonine protein kinase
LALTLGTRLGVYEIIAPIGEGGMGQVFHARDTKLDRDVAIKILSEAFAHDADRLARFTREAKTLASLNHPNIAGIYGLEESGGVSALVMELVRGNDLSQRIARGAIPIDEALPIAKQIAGALEAAHEQGIIHRDLKPANVKVRPDGTVKVLDFGLAKAFESGGTSAQGTVSPTLSLHATQAGVILGTAAYMSPEQAAGKPVDKRSDLWAFGVVLTEMLTGRQVFAGETVSHVLASVLKDEPDWTTLPPNTPAPIQRLLRRCLVKDRKRRFADAADAALEIDDALATSSAESPVRAATASRPTIPTVLGALAAVALVAAVAALALAGCGEEGIEVAKSNPDYEGAELFVEHCSGCHTFRAAGTQGSATKVSTRENKDGPNFNQRKETEEDVIYAIENGGFSSGPMPQNIVTGEDAQKIAAFIAKYSGPNAPQPPGD